MKLRLSSFTAALFLLLSFTMSVGTTEPSHPRAHHREVNPTEGSVTAEDVSGKVWSQYELARAAGK